MSCTITTGRARGCRNSSGGVLEFVIGNHPGVADYFDVDEDNVITGITSFTGYTFVPTKNSSSWTEEIQVSLENGSVGFSQSATMTFTRSDSALRNQVLLLAQANVLVIARERSGRYFLLGATEGCEISAGNGGSGTNLTDLNGQNLVFTAMENAPAYEVSASIIAGLIGA